MELNNLYVDGPTNMEGTHFIVTLEIKLDIVAKDSIDAAHQAVNKLADYSGKVYGERYNR